MLRGSQRISSDCRSRVGGVIAVAVRLRYWRRCGGKAPVGLKIPALGANRRRPVGEMTPPVFSHHKELNRHFVQPLPLPFDMCIQPGQCFVNDLATGSEASMSPGTDEQIGLFPGLAQCLVVL